MLDTHHCCVNLIQMLNNFLNWFGFLGDEPIGFQTKPQNGKGFFLGD